MGEASIYLDGELQDLHLNPNLTAPVRYGQVATLGPFAGDVDDVGIWKRALTGDEISRLWNSGVGIPIGLFAPEASTGSLLLLAVTAMSFCRRRP